MGAIAADIQSAKKIRVTARGRPQAKIGNKNLTTSRICIALEESRLSRKFYNEYLRLGLKLDMMMHCLIYKYLPLIVFYFAFIFCFLILMFWSSFPSLP